MDIHNYQSREALGRDIQLLKTHNGPVGIIVMELIPHKDLLERAQHQAALLATLDELFGQQAIYRETERRLVVMSASLPYEEFSRRRKKLRHIIAESEIACYGYAWSHSTQKIPEQIALAETYLEAMKNRILNAAEKRYFSMDRLTGLASMEFFTDIATQIVNSDALHDQFVVVYFNVDNFKTFNSEYGYQAGDLFLKNLAQLIADTFPNYIVGRAADDHFMVLTNQTQLLERIDRVHKGAHNMQKNVVIEVKAGICTCRPEVSITQTYDWAKLACDTLKGDYSKNYCYFDEELHKKLIREKYFVDNLDHAIAQEHLKVVYQPIMRVLSDKFCAMESLVRWDDPKLGFLPPGEFIPTLEKHSLINKLDAFVIDRVCRDILFSMQIGESILPVSVNLSRMDFQLCDIYETVCSTVEKYHVPRGLLHLEVTESALNDDEEQMSECIRKFQQAGFEIWLDDFGSEYSTLNTLQNFQFDVLKIDMKFFSTFEKNEKARIIIMSVIDMAKRLHIRTLAEGIETPEQYAFLKRIGCDKAQGFLLCRPKPLQMLFGHGDRSEATGKFDYYNRIAQVNYLSTDPIADFEGGSELSQAQTIAIVEYQNDQFSYLFANDSFVDCLKSMGVPSLEISKVVINDDSYKLKTRLSGVARKSHASGKIETIDFIYNGFQIHLHAKEIACQGNTSALFVTMVNLSKAANVNRVERLETALNFLYSIYNRVDLIDITNDCAENIYLNAQYYHTLTQGKGVEQALKDFAFSNIAADDRQKFLEFYDYRTLPERIAQSGKRYIIQPLRTKRGDSEISLQLYLIIQISGKNSIRYLSCARDIGVNDGMQYDTGIAENVKQAMEWYQLIVKETKAAVLEWNFQTGQAYASGSSYQYLIGHENLYDILDNCADMQTVHPDDIPMMARFFKQSKSGAKRAEATLRLKLMDGSYRWCKLIGIFQKDSMGNPARTLGIILDMDQQKYERLQQLKLLNQIPIGIGIFEIYNGAARQVFMNDAFYKLIDDGREQRIERQNANFINGVYPPDRPAVLDLIQKVIDGSDYETVECRGLTGTDKPRWMRLTASVPARKGEYIPVYCTYVGLGDK